MRGVTKVGLAVLLLGGGAAAVGLELFLEHGISTRDEPTALEAFVARRLRNMSVPREHRKAKNPVPISPEVLERARAHFADHCASCHGNDGRGKTKLGQNLYPKAPDMWLDDSQSLPDGHLFAIIKNGVRLTGMAAWGEDTPKDDQVTWELVHFIRHLPKITPAELTQMESMNPKSPMEMAEQEEMRKFLEGDAPERPVPSSHKH
jgi:cytochrome c